MASAHNVVKVGCQNNNFNEYAQAIVSIENPLSEEVGGTRLLYYALCVRMSRTENRKKNQKKQEKAGVETGFLVGAGYKG